MFQTFSPNVKMSYGSRPTPGPQNSASMINVTKDTPPDRKPVNNAPAKVPAVSHSSDAGVATNSVHVPVKKETVDGITINEVLHQWKILTLFSWDFRLFVSWPTF